MSARHRPPYPSPSPGPGTSKNVVNACEACRSRKRKCDGAKPVCGNCARHARECVFDPESDLRKRKRPQPDYVKSLEGQIQAMRQIICELKATGGESAASRNLEDALNNINQQHCDDGSFLDQSPAEADDDVDEDGDGDELPSKAAMDELSSLVWRLDVGESGEHSFRGPSGGLKVEPPCAHPVLLSGALEENADAQPDAVYAIEEDLTGQAGECFRQHVNVFHHFVDDDFFTRVSELKLPQMLLHIVVRAIGCMFSEAEAHQIESLERHAEGLALRCCRTYPSEEVVQALSGLCLLELGRGNHNMCWMFNSMAGGLVLHLGLHAIGVRGVPSTADASHVQQNRERVRTFWAFFLMDRIAALVTGRNCVLPWRRVKTPFFSTVMTAADAGDLNALAFDHQCRLFFVQDKFLDQIYAFDFEEKPVADRHALLVDARQSLLEFYQTIDARLRLRPRPGVSSPAVLLFHMCYQTSLVLVHRPFLHEDTASSSWRLALRCCTSGATFVTRLLRTFRRKWSLRTAPFFVAHLVITAATIHLFTATSKKLALRERAAAHVAACVDALEELAAAHAEAAKNIALLQQLAYRWDVVFTLPPHLARNPWAAARRDGGAPDHDVMMVDQEHPFEGLERDRWQFQALDPCQNGSVLDAASEFPLAEDVIEWDWWLSPERF